MIDQLQEQIKVVIKARELAQGANEAKKLAMGEWETQHADLLNSVGLLGQQQGEAEARLRELTLEAYAETGDKAPAPGVGIREVTKLSYEAGVALAWAKEHGLALKLDVPAFEKIMKADKTSADSFSITITTEPQATIATNLDEIRLRDKEDNK